ncbi:hypothetical protein QDX81_10185 [Pseudomonas sp. CW003PS]|nr:hypothetical protein QDX81_10185 [Pseudomonas sp. CW003PS]
MKKFLYATLAFSSLAAGNELPAGIIESIPADYSVWVYESGELDGDTLTDYLVVLHRPEETTLAKEQEAPPRPLLLFTQTVDGAYALRARNDQVVFKINEGGQCDPFDADAQGLAIKHRYFTVENGVACGQHWTDYMTFRYDPALKDWVFHKRIFENWVLNESQDPDADALVRNVHKVMRGKREAPIRFETYRP